MQKTVCFTTLGCKVNQYDSQAMLEEFERHGYAVAPAGAPADVYVVNTCTVTGTGDKKSLQAIRRCRRRNPGAELVVTGCLAQRMGEALRETGARLILGTQYRARVVELLEQAVREGMQMVAVEGVSNAPYEPLSIHSHEGHTRAVMKIQEGCELEPKTVANEMADRLSAEFVQAIGRKFVLYRESKENKQIELPRR